MLLLFKILTIIFYLNTTNLFALINKRTKCAIECYKKCSESGTPQSVYCNCPFTENDNCDENINEELFKEKTVENLIEFKSGYTNIRIIWVNVNPIPNAFIYIFEISFQSISIPVWIFAGASSSPKINFSIPDACRDYQFRLILVLRSTDPKKNLIVFRGQKIPVEFPPFVVAEETIHLDRPKQSNDGQTLHSSVSWQHPSGYEDTDIYGYSPPTAYPISCQTPEEKLSQPRLELIQGGARLHFALPIDVLNDKCKIYMEIKICVRIKPFDIQISTEIDCQKFPNLQYCKKEDGPQCTGVVDLWGRNDGRATVVWQKPNAVKNTFPNYYIVNWGPTQNSGSSLNRKIINGQHIKVPGNITKIELTPQWGIQYGLQICAFYYLNNEKEENNNNLQINPFNISPIIPFYCNPCAAPELKFNENNNQERCIECTKIEQRQSPSKILNSSSPNYSSSVDCVGPVCASSNYTSTHFISSGIVSMDIFGSNINSNFTEKEKNETENIKEINEKENEEEDDDRQNFEQNSWKEKEKQLLRQLHSKTLPRNPISLNKEENEEEEFLLSENVELFVETTTTKIEEEEEEIPPLTTTTIELTTTIEEINKTITKEIFETTNKLEEKINKNNLIVDNNVTINNNVDLIKEENKEIKINKNISTINTNLNLSNNSSSLLPENLKIKTKITTKSVYYSSTEKTKESTTELLKEINKEGRGGGGGSSRSPLDPKKLILAGPIFFFLGLSFGLILLFTFCINRRRQNSTRENFHNHNRRHRHPLPNFNTSLTPPVIRQQQKPNNILINKKYPTSSVLATRTAINCGGGGSGGEGCGINKNSVGQIIQQNKQTNKEYSSCSCASTASAISSSIVTPTTSTNISVSTQKQQPSLATIAHKPKTIKQQEESYNNQNFADNTSRFFMTSTPSSVTNINNQNKNVHF
uniref:EGF-like domain-containing protein n=1 Tax=Meloidogyne incognita TaxID=6306 RepID=A0A914KVM3_MELIC